MSGTFTPGPWTAVASGRLWKVTANPADARDDICNVIGFSRAGSPEADAHLIAAAPDLYSALDDAVNYLAAWLALAKDDQASALLDKCTAVLGKAEGRQP